MKKKVVIFLEPDDINRLVSKAKEAGFDGRGATSNYIEKICREPICFLDNNVKALLKTINFKI